jgi:hypothetical protein
VSDDWRRPVNVRHFPAGVVGWDDDESREPLVMAFQKGDPDIELYWRGEVCSNCAYRMPAPPSKRSLHLFDTRDYPHYDPAFVRQLIRNGQCPVCRTPVSAEINQRLMVRDEWSDEATRHERARLQADREEERREREAFAKRQRDAGRA